jgi:hypothetical protein
MSEHVYVWVWEPDGPEGTGFYATVASAGPDTTLVRVVSASGRREHGSLVRVPTRCVYVPAVSR